MINKNILHTALVNKFNNLTLHSIVNECFVSGIPMDIKDASKDELVALRNYSYRALESLGGFSLVMEALHNEKDIHKSNLIKNIYSVCMEASNEVSDRITKDADLSGEIPMPEIVNKAAFNDSEYKKFIKNVDSIGVDDISKIIQDKTLAVLKDEQNAYAKENDIENELNDAFADADSKQSLESYMDIVLDKKDARHHVTLFSKIQERVYESLITATNDTDDYMKFANEVTFESFLKPLKREKNWKECLESLTELANDNQSNEIPDDKKNKMMILISTVIYTVMETLKTLNLYTPPAKDIQSFVNTCANNSNKDNAACSVAIEKVQDLLDKSIVCNYDTMSNESIVELNTELKQIKELFKSNMLNNNGFTSSRGDILNKLDNIITKIDKILNERYNTSKKEKPLSFYEKRNREEDIASLNKINRLYSKNPQVAEIRLGYNPENDVPGIINVSCANESHQIINKTFIPLSAKINNYEFIGYIQEAFTKSTLCESDKKVTICFEDGTSKKIALN